MDAFEKSSNEKANDTVEKIMLLCEELNLKVDSKLPMEKNSYLSAWAKKAPF